MSDLVEHLKSQERVRCGTVVQQFFDSVYISPHDIANRFHAVSCTGNAPLVTPVNVRVKVGYENFPLQIHDRSQVSVRDGDTHLNQLHIVHIGFYEQSRRLQDEDEVSKKYGYSVSIHTNLILSRVDQPMYRIKFFDDLYCLCL